MSRLPRPFQPAWPLVKRGHRLGTRAVGAISRHTTILAGDRAVPNRAARTAEETATLEPEAVRMHLGGPAELLDRLVPPGEHPDHWVFRRAARFGVPRRFTLEIRRGQVVGDYAAHITAGGVLDYETSPYFGIDGANEHPIYLRPRLPQPIELSGSLATLATRGSMANYYHFLMDVLPRWGVLQETMPGFTPDRFYVNRTTRFQQELLGMVGLGDVDVVQPGKHLAVRAERLFAPCIANWELMAPPWTTDWLRERLRPRDTVGLPRRIYLSRGSKPHTRRLVNELEIFLLLERHGFVCLDPGDLTVQEQIDQFAAAEMIVAPHGAGLTNLAFCSPGVRVLELFAPKYVNPCYWVMAANIPDAHYRYLVCGSDTRPPGSPMNGVLTDITADPKAVARSLEQLLS